MLSCYLAAFNHPKPKHALPHLLARFRIGKHLAPSWRVAKWHAGVMTDIMWHVLRKWWHSDSVFGFGENIIRMPSILASQRAHWRPLPWAFLCFCQPHLCQSETSFRSLDLPNFWLVSFVSVCVLLVLQLKSTFYNSLSTTVKRSWIWQLECVPLTLHVASLVENQTLPVSGCRLNENDISASIFADLYPMSAFLTIRGDNDTPCVCSSPFQRFSNEVLRSPRTICVGRGRCDFNHLSLGAMPWRRLFCESRDRHIVMDLPHFGQLVRYEGFFALPLTAINWASKHTKCTIS